MMTFPTEWKNKKCSKPPTSIILFVNFVNHNLRMLDVSWIFLVCLGAEKTIPVECPHVHAPMDDLWKIYGGFMEDLWKIYGGSMEDLWRIYLVQY